MAHKLEVNVVGKTDTVLTCDDVKEGDSGIHLYDTKNGKDKIGYVPFDNLDYVTLRHD